MDASQDVAVVADLVESCSVVEESEAEDDSDGSHEGAVLMDNNRLGLGIIITEHLGAADSFQRVRLLRRFPGPSTPQLLCSVISLC